ncbi:MAG: tol-pal system YbgF family protein, partial [Candidatus Neomarinimicrobiota bacterium]
MRPKRGAMGIVTAPAGLVVAVMLAILPYTGAGLAAQDQQDEDLYLMDLGIIIEPGDQDSVTWRDSLSVMEDVDLMVGKESPGAAFIESTKELRAVLDDLSGRINELENSLNQDVEAVRLENERLRALIRKIQANRKENEVSQAVAETLEEEISVTGAAAAVVPLPENPGYHHVLQAYRAGQFEEVVLMCQALDQSSLSPAEAVQVAYWCADAYFQRGLFDKALESLDKVSASDQELGDDAIILQGL